MDLDEAIATTLRKLQNCKTVKLAGTAMISSQWEWPATWLGSVTGATLKRHRGQ